MPASDTHNPPAPGQLLEASLYAADLDAAEAFYGGILGLKRMFRAGDRHVFYRVGRTILLIFNPARTETSDPDATLPVPPHGARGPGHVCFAVSASDIDAWRTCLTKAGHTIEADFYWPNGARSIYCRDPAGNSVEFAEQRLWG